MIVFERLLTSWLFWLAMLAIAVTLAINEAFFPRHVPEAKPQSDRPAAPQTVHPGDKNRWVHLSEIPTYGYAETGEVAMAAFANSWTCRRSRMDGPS